MALIWYHQFSEASASRLLKTLALVLVRKVAVPALLLDGETEELGVGMNEAGMLLQRES